MENHVTVSTITICDRIGRFGKKGCKKRGGWKKNPLTKELKELKKKYYSNPHNWYENEDFDEKLSELGERFQKLYKKLDDLLCE